MASRVVVQITDDITGKAGGDIATMTFWDSDGKEFEIDLDGENRVELRAAQEEVAKLLAPFVAHARRAHPKGNGRGHSAGKGPTGDADRSRKIREWAAETGREINPRGRIAKDVVEAYDVAQRQAVLKEGAAGAGKATEKPVKAAQAPEKKTTVPRKRAAKKTAQTAAQ